MGNPRGFKVENRRSTLQKVTSLPFFRVMLGMRLVPIDGISSVRLSSLSSTRIPLKDLDSEPC